MRVHTSAGGRQRRKKKKEASAVELLVHWFHLERSVHLRLRQDSVPVRKRRLGGRDDGSHCVDATAATTAAAADGGVAVLISPKSE
ncbi:hypothetical protein TYRP_020883 [Tyrophagus putrescentiae]|nr:hypothetical protein TYRP_020883 [Tyrophagus putrescentiae]